MSIQPRFCDRFFISWKHNVLFSIYLIVATTHTTEMPPGDSEGTLTVEPDHSSQTQPGLNASPTDGSTPHYQGTTENGCIRESLHCILIPFIVIFCDFSSAFLVC